MFRFSMVYRQKHGPIAADMSVEFTQTHAEELQLQCMTV